MPSGSRLVARIRRPRAAGQQLIGEPGDGVDEVLAVVEQQQHLAVGESVLQPVDAVARRRGPGAVEHHGLPQPQRAEHRRRDCGGIRDRRQLHDPDAVCHPVESVGEHLGREPGLAGTAGPHQGDQPVGVKDHAEPGDVGLPPDEAGDWGPQVGPAYRPVRWCVGRSGRLAAQHPQVGFAQPGARVDPERGGELVADPGVRREGRGLPALVGEGGDQQRGDPFVQWVRHGEGLELVQRLGGPAEVDQCLQPVGRGAHPQVLVADRSCPGELGTDRVGERRSAPQRRCLVQQLHRPVRLAGTQCLTAGPSQPAEPLRIHVVDREVEQIATSGLPDGGGVAERATQPGHQRLQRVRLVGGDAVAPYGVDEDRGVDRLAGVHRQPRQQGAQPPARQLDGNAVDLDLEWAEETHLHRAGHT